MRIRVMLADNHVLVRQALKTLLESEGMEVVGGADQGRDAVALAAALKPDVAVLDVSMPVMNGLDAARQMHAVSPTTRPLLLTRHDEDAYVAAALRAGIRGYVLKSQAATDLVNAIRQVHRGGVYLSPGISGVLADAFLSKTDRTGERLSPRERQVVRLVGEGKSTKEIAVAMGISVKTVESHRTRVMQKLGLHNVAGLVRYAIREGLIKP